MGLGVSHTPPVATRVTLRRQYRSFKAVWAVVVNYSYCLGTGTIGGRTVVNVLFLFGLRFGLSPNVFTGHSNGNYIAAAQHVALTWVYAALGVVVSLGVAWSLI